MNDYAEILSTDGEEKYCESILQFQKKIILKAENFVKNLVLNFEIELLMIKS